MTDSSDEQDVAYSRFEAERDGRLLANAPHLIGVDPAYPRAIAW